MNMAKKNPIGVSEIRYLIKRFKTIDIKVIGNSMIPSFYPNDIVEISLQNPQCHDVILFDDREKITIHRVVFIYKETIISRGDNSLFYEKSHMRNYLGTIVKRKDIHNNTLSTYQLGWLYQLGAFLLITLWKSLRKLYFILKKSDEQRDALYNCYREKILQYNKFWKRIKEHD